MSQAAVERLLGKLVTDEAFRARFFRDPAAASFASGIAASPSELEALARLPVEAVAEFSTHVDARLCRLTIEGDARAA